MPEPMRIAVVGDGKMGRALRELAPAAGFEVVAWLGEREAAGGITGRKLGGAELAIEFTIPSAAASNVRDLLDEGVPVVCGTTGWDAERRAVEDEVRARGGAFLWAANFSLGVHIFRRIVAEAARQAASLGAGFDMHLVETHHAQKLDAPSGTAVLLAEAAAAGLGRPVPVTSVRVGSVPGTHELLLDGPFEQLRLVHEARDRRLFAHGALTAARWLRGRSGVFTIDDVLTGAGETS